MSEETCDAEPMNLAAAGGTSQEEAAPGRLLSELTFVAFDVETTGLSAVACRVVELSGVRFRLGDGGLQNSGGEAEFLTFSELIKPDQPIPPEVAQIHGISDAMVADCPAISQVLPRFREFSKDTLLIAHNASFDVEFLKLESLRNGQELPDNLVADTLAMAQQMRLGTVNHKLKTLCEHFGFPGSTYHRALDDSIYVRKLFEKLVQAGNLKTTDDLVSLGALFSFNCEQRFAPPVLTAAEKERLSLIREALNCGKQIKMVYESEFRSTRIVSPLAIMESRGSYYITAFCTRSRAERTFRLDRIREADLVGV